MTQRYEGLYHYNAYQTVHVGSTYSEERPIPSTCHLRIVEVRETTVVIATELADNEGMSVTNAWEWLASCVVRDHGLDPQRTRFIEHYGPASYDDSSMPDIYDEVTFTWRGTGAEEPRWRRLQGEDLAALQPTAVEGLRCGDGPSYSGRSLW